MKRNYLALVAVLFLTAVALMFFGTKALEKRTPSPVVPPKKYERIFTPKSKFSP